MDEKVAVGIVEDGKDLVYTDAKGEKKKYSQDLISHIWVSAKTLVVCSGFSRLDSESTQKPATRRYLRGLGTLDHGSISVLGNPENSTKELSIHITSRTATEHAEAVAHRAERIKEIVANRKPDEFSWRGEDQIKYFDVRLGFSEGSWEYDVEDRWWMELYVSEALLDELAESILKGQFRSWSVAFPLVGIYSRDSYSRTDEWFLRPDRTGDGDPESAAGCIDRWDIQHAGVDATPAWKRPSRGVEPATPMPAGKTNAALEIGSRLCGVVQGTLGLAQWLLYLVGAFSVYLLSNVEKTSTYWRSEVFNALAFGWIVIGVLLFLQVCSGLVGYVVRSPIEAQIRGINLRDPAVHNELWEEFKNAAITSAIFYAIFLVVPLVIAQFKFKYFW